MARIIRILYPLYDRKLFWVFDRYFWDEIRNILLKPCISKKRNRISDRYVAVYPFMHQYLFSTICQKEGYFQTLHKWNLESSQILWCFNYKIICEDSLKNCILDRRILEWIKLQRISSCIYWRKGRKRKWGIKVCCLLPMLSKTDQDKIIKCYFVEDFITILCYHKSYLVYF